MGGLCQAKPEEGGRGREVEDGTAASGERSVVPDPWADVASKWPEALRAGPDGGPSGVPRLRGDARPGARPKRVQERRSLSSSDVPGIILCHSDPTEIGYRRGGENPRFGWLSSLSRLCGHRLVLCQF